jgi:hypothetical protein
VSICWSLLGTVPGACLHEYDLQRFGEHSSQAVMSRFKHLKAAAIDELLSFPALFYLRGPGADVRVPLLGSNQDSPDPKGQHKPTNEFGGLMPLCRTSLPQVTLLDRDEERRLVRAPAFEPGQPLVPHVGE